MSPFPEGFLWGSATSAHQVEGGNWNSDWWVWEHTPGSPCVAPSGDAIDHYHRYADDMTLLAELGLGAYRFSLEWARIEPEPGEFSTAALDHYARMVETCRQTGMEPIVTLHHFTSPRWVAERGGWTQHDTAERFGLFCDRVAGRLGDLLGRVCTINEPNVVSSNGYLVGLFPPGKRDETLRRQANTVLASAHRRSVEAVRAAAPGARVGLTLAMPEYVSADGGDVEAFRSADEDVFLDAATGDDFIGVQTYTRIRIGPDGPLDPEKGVETTLMGWEFWPESLEPAVKRAYAKTGLPVLVTENGIATSDDARRLEYTGRALAALERCLEDGVPVEGYLHWSAFDNFEWAYGYEPTFGLVAVDGATLERTPKPSAFWLGEVARRNAL